MLSKKACFILCILLAVVPLFIIDQNNIKNRDDKKNVSISIKFEKNNYSCNAIDVNAKQFKVNIDGVQYPKIVPLYQNKSINFSCLNSLPKTKTILFWTKFVDFAPILRYGEGLDVLKEYNCPVTNCELTRDKRKLQSSDLVLFYLRDPIPSFPINRPPNQRWVHVIYESPLYCFHCDSYENTFNLSASQNRYSDFSSLYWTDSGMYWDEATTKFESIIKNQSDSFPAIISNCDSRSPRLKLLKILGKYLPVKIYGSCGEPCIDKFNMNNNECRRFVANKYKFYFAFENSLCKDYITEKFFDILKYNTLPIVFGDGNYDTYIPKSGYINVFDFEKPKDLADYLLYLDKNQTAYDEYFKWKVNFKYDDGHPIGGFLCEMCIKMQLEEYFGQIENKMFNSLHSKFGPEENCRDLKIHNDETFEFSPAPDGSIPSWAKKK